MFAPDLTPQTAGRVWSQGIRLGWSRFRRLFALSTLLGFISLLPTILLAEKIGRAAVTPDSILDILKQGHTVLELLLLEFLVLVLGSLVGALLIRRIASDAPTGHFADELRVALGRVWPLVAAGIVCFITVLIGVVISGIIGSILGALIGTRLAPGGAIAVARICVVTAMLFIVIKLGFFQFAIVLDGKGPVSSLNYSSALVSRNWWRVFMVLLMTIVVMMGIGALVMLPFMHWLPVRNLADTGRTLLVKGVLNLVCIAVCAPFGLGIFYVLYLDLKMRRAQKSTPIAVVQA